MVNNFKETEYTNTAGCCTYAFIVVVTACMRAAKLHSIKFHYRGEEVGKKSPLNEGLLMLIVSEGGRIINCVTFVQGYKLPSLLRGSVCLDLC